MASKKNRNTKSARQALRARRERRNKGSLLGIDDRVHRFSGGPSGVGAGDSSGPQEGYVHPDTGLVYGGLDADGQPIWNRPGGISENATWNGSEWVDDEGGDEGGGEGQQGDSGPALGYVHPDTGLVYAGLDIDGKPIWNRPENVSENATWTNGEWVEPADNPADEPADNGDNMATFTTPATETLIDPLTGLPYEVEDTETGDEDIQTLAPYTTIPVPTDV